MNREWVLGCSLQSVLELFSVLPHFQQIAISCLNLQRGCRKSHPELKILILWYGCILMHKRGIGCFPRQNNEWITMVSRWPSWWVRLRGHPKNTAICDLRRSLCKPWRWNTTTLRGNCSTKKRSFVKPWKNMIPVAWHWPNWLCVGQILVVLLLAGLNYIDGNTGNPCALFPAF